MPYLSVKITDFISPSRLLRGESRNPVQVPSNRA
jgi:hypothetical protein